MTRHSVPGPLLLVSGIAPRVLRLRHPRAAARDERDDQARRRADLRHVRPLTPGRSRGVPLLVPKGWQADADHLVGAARPAHPVALPLLRCRPLGAMKFFPASPTSGPITASSCPPSVRLPSFGAPVAEPLSLAAAFTASSFPDSSNINGPEFSSAKSAGAERLARRRPTPRLRPPPREVRIRIVYQEGAGRSRCEIYAVVIQFVTDPGGYRHQLWYIDYIFFAFKAGQGQLDAHSKTFQTMILSLRVDAPSFTKVVNTKEDSSLKWSYGT